MTPERPPSTQDDDQDIVALCESIAECSRRAERLDLKFTAYLIEMAHQSVREVLEGVDTEIQNLN